MRLVVLVRVHIAECPSVTLSSSPSPSTSPTSTRHLPLSSQEFGLVCPQKLVQLLLARVAWSVVKGHLNAELYLTLLFRLL
jgi:hypothetical protein